MMTHSGNGRGDDFMLEQNEVDYVAKLAKLRFDGGTKEKIAKDLSGILEYVALLDEVGIEGVEPLTHVMETVNVTRSDEVGDTLGIEEALANAPDRDGRYFRTPKLL
jgi:aspartyl-tRNA(Asn)/glutamyl-tRNA(Gln) amidotransferase subunit C